MMMMKRLFVAALDSIAVENETAMRELVFK